MSGVVRRLARAPWTLLKAVFGWLVLFEARNKVLLAPSAMRLHRIEDAETRRLAATLTSPPSALVATVIATHRRPEALRAAVRSALDQTVRDQVVIVVDDGAGLPELPDDPRLFAVSLAHNTAVAGVVRNVGIRLTHSRYVAFLDDDNLWEPDHLERALAVLDSPADPTPSTRHCAASCPTAPRTTSCRCPTTGAARPARPSWTPTPSSPAAIAPCTSAAAPHTGGAAPRGLGADPPVRPRAPGAACAAPDRPIPDEPGQLLHAMASAQLTLPQSAPTTGG